MRMYMNWAATPLTPALAATAAACVVEPVLTSLGGGGFLPADDRASHRCLTTSSCRRHAGVVPRQNAISTR